MTAERHEIPGAVHVRQRLQQADYADRQERRNRHERRGASQGAQIAIDVARNPSRQHDREQSADRPASARVQEPIDYPAVRAAPLPMFGVEESGARNRYVERSGREDCG